MALQDEQSDYPPNVQVVYTELKQNAPLTQRDLVENTNLPFRVVSDALDELKETESIQELVYSHGPHRLYLFTEHGVETAPTQRSAV